MFKGIISLFTSGIIFNPFVLLGIISGSWCYLNMEPNDIRNLFYKEEFYIGIAVLAFFYVTFFSKIYKTGGRYLDWSAMFMRMIANFARFFISFLLVMPFISMISIF